ncbi:MAG TPA: hypothetical protein VJ600_05235 [Holophagaceae bacterium]|nr:hypothetical protein [Holophagaceae bacterium]
MKGAPLLMALLAAGTGCYRSTGSARPTVVAEEIPPTGGDRVPGNKSTAGPGDYYLGNDNIHMAVDGAVFGDRQGQFGAPSGGAILDVGSIALDQSYKRVPLPTDNVDRIGLVANQDPDLPLVFERYAASSSETGSLLSMTGRLLDRKHKLAGATWDASGLVEGVEVDHSISLLPGQIDFELTTTIRNTGSTALPIRNIADYLTQRGGGFRFIVPGVADVNGQPVGGWGAEIPGSDFTQPLATGVQAPMVGLMGAEPSARDMDVHQSLGFMPVDQARLLVTSDPQRALEENRPKFPARLAVGSLPSADLPAGQSLSYRRRLFVTGGESQFRFTPVQVTGVFNLMASDRSFIDKSYLGAVFYSTIDSARFKGPRQTEVRFERYTGAASDPSTDANPAHWTLERVEWREAGENFLSLGSSSLAPVGITLPVINDPNHAGQAQPYRVVIRNRDNSETDYRFVNMASTTAVGYPVPLQPSFTQVFAIGDYLYPERSQYTTEGGVSTGRAFYSHSFYTRQSGTDPYLLFSYLPQRIMFLAVDPSGAFTPAQDPDVQRLRYLAGTYNTILRAKTLGRDSGGFQFAAGNQTFGSAYVTGESDGSFYFRPGNYVGLGTRGPLGPITSLPISVTPGQVDVRHAFVAPPSPMPAGWVAFDVPGPSQITSGGMLPAEQLTSALAEGVQVVARDEEDKLIDAGSEASDYLSEFDPTSSVRRQPIDGQLFAVSGRRSNLAEGPVSSLFTPAPNSGLAFGGAALSTGWTLADFIARAEGQYTVVHRPRGPQGLFTRKGGVAAGVALGTGANAWWTATDPKSEGKTTGDFDAIELIRAEGCDPADPSAWFAEFKTLRQDWFNLLNLQAPTAFTKGLGLSSGIYSLDTPVGLARTYLKTGSTALTQANMAPVLDALRSGAAVASTGPLLDVSLNGSAGPGALVSGPAGSVTLDITYYAPTWVPVDEVRVVVNGVVVQTLLPSAFIGSLSDSRFHKAQITLDLATAAGGKDAWVVVEAGVPLTTSGAYAVGTPWNRIMKGIYPVAVTNPIFVDVNGGGYTPPLP